MTVQGSQGLTSGCNRALEWLGVTATDIGPELVHLPLAAWSSSAR